MGEWREVKLGNFIIHKKGFAFKSKDLGESGHRVVKVKDFTDNSIDISKCQFLDDSLAKNYYDYKLKKDDVVVSTVGSWPSNPASIVGKVIKVPEIAENSLLNQNAVRLRVKEDMLQSYLYYKLRTQEFSDYLISGAQGSANQASITLEDIFNFSLYLPPLKEQKAIAEVLSSLDNKIDLLHRQNKTLEDLAQTLFRQWFIEEAKDEWEEKPLKEVTKISIGRTPPRKEFHWFSKSSKDVKWISIKDMGEDGVFVFDTSEYLTKEAVDTFNIPIIAKNTVILSFKMTLGRVKITTEDMLSNEAIAQFKFIETTPFNKEYLYLFLKTYPYQILGSTSSIVTSINSTMIKDMLIPIPDKTTISKFTQIVEEQFNKIFANQQQIKTLENMRDTLLPKLMSGEWRIKYE